MLAAMETMRRKVFTCGVPIMCMSNFHRHRGTLVLLQQSNMFALRISIQSSSGRHGWFLFRAHSSCLTGEEESCVFDEGEECLIMASSDVGKTKTGLEIGTKQGKTMSKTKLKKLQKQEQDKERKMMVFKAFSTYYEEQYGSRWTALLGSLKADARFSCLINKYATPPIPTPLQRPIGFLKLAALESSERLPHPERDSRNLYGYYLMDAASLLVTEALELQGEEKVLDMCAAPGGKTLAILQQLMLPLGSLASNDSSESRRRRLAKVIEDYIPQDLRHCVQVTKRDGIKWGHNDHYDKVLVDAPCSSERHLLHDPSEMATWTPRRTVNCAKRQLLLLSSALRSVKVGGTVVYSTCSISYRENDGVISKALQKLKTDFEVVHKEWEIGEATEHGWIVLPDTSHGWGPIYFAVLRKVCDTGVTEQGEDNSELSQDEESEVED